MKSAEGTNNSDKSIRFIDHAGSNQWIFWMCFFCKKTKKVKKKEKKKTEKKKERKKNQREKRTILNQEAPGPNRTKRLVKGQKISQPSHPPNARNYYHLLHPWWEHDGKWKDTPTRNISWERKMWRREKIGKKRKITERYPLPLHPMSLKPPNCTSKRRKEKSGKI